MYDATSTLLRRNFRGYTRPAIGYKTATHIIDANDEIAVIQSGQVEVTVNGIASRMNEGSLLYSAPNDKRNLRTIGSTPTFYQVIRVTSAKSPRPVVN